MICQIQVRFVIQWVLYYKVIGSICRTSWLKTMCQTHVWFVLQWVVWKRRVVSKSRMSWLKNNESKN